MKRYKILQLLSNTKLILAIYLAIAIVASVQLYMLGTHPFAYNPKNYPGDLMSQPAIRAEFAGKRYTDYNNYIIFKQSLFHLANGENLYTIYPNEQWDLYKYSPSFPILMLPMAYLPDLFGLTAWNLINALALFAAILALPIDRKKQSFLLWFVLPELLTSMQSAQSNGLLVALMVASFAFLSRRKVAVATLLLVIATFIKPYAIVGFSLFLFYPGKIKAALYTLGWTAAIILLPLVFTSPHSLFTQYHNWFALMAADKSASYGLSVMGWLHSWFGLSHINNDVMLIGIILFLLPLTRIRLYDDRHFQLLFLASILIWVIIFNYKAESPTFIIAMVGAGIWYVASPSARWRTALIIIAFIGTSLTPTDLFPHFLHQALFKPYVIKAVPCIILWCATLSELVTLKRLKPGMNKQTVTTALPNSSIHNINY